MAKLSTKGLIVIALVLSLATSFLVYSYLNNLTSQVTKEGVPVVVAKMDIPPKTRITAEMVQEMKIPADYIQPGAMTELNKVIGVVAREHVTANEQITQRLLMLEGRSVGFTGIIPRDKRAITVAVSDVAGVAGFVKAGDYVDVVLTFDSNTVGDHVSKMVLQNIQVLAVNSDTEAGAGDRSKEVKDAVKTGTVTLAVTPLEATQVTLGEEKGKIRLALRPYITSDGLVATSSVTPKDLVGIQEAPGQKSGGGDKGPAEAAPAPSSARSQDSSPGIQVIRGTKVSGQ